MTNSVLAFPDFETRLHEALGINTTEILLSDVDSLCRFELFVVIEDLVGVTLDETLLETTETWADLYRVYVLNSLEP